MEDQYFPAASQKDGGVDTEDDGQHLTWYLIPTNTLAALEFKRVARDRPHLFISAEEFSKVYHEYRSAQFPLDLRQINAALELNRSYLQHGFRFGPRKGFSNFFFENTLTKKMTPIEFIICEDKDDSGSLLLQLPISERPIKLDGKDVDSWIWFEDRPKMKINNGSTISFFPYRDGVEMSLSVFIAGGETNHETSKIKQPEAISHQSVLIRRTGLSTIYLAKSDQTPSVYTIKELRGSKINKVAFREAKLKILEMAKHPNIVDHFETPETEGKDTIAVEYIENGNLFHYVSKHGPIPEQDVKTIAAQILSALSFLDKHEVALRNISPFTILVASFDPWKVKLCDPLKVKLGFLLQPSYYNHGPTLEGGPLVETLYYALTGIVPFAPEVDNDVSAVNETAQWGTIDSMLSSLREENVSRVCLDFFDGFFTRDRDRHYDISRLQRHRWLNDVPSLPTSQSPEAVTVQVSLSNTQLGDLASDQLALEQASEQARTITDSGYGTASSYTAVKAAQAQTDEDIPVDDTATVYSDISSMSDTRVETYNATIAEDLVSKLGLENVDDQALERLVDSLPDLLKALAIKMGYDAPSQMHRDVMVFLHKHRNEIAVSFRQSLDIREYTKKEPISTEVMDRWRNAPFENEYEDTGSVFHELFDGENDTKSNINDTEGHSRDTKSQAGSEAPSLVVSDDDNGADLPGLEKYRELIIGDSGFDWLLANLRREAVLERAQPDIMGNIRTEILQTLQTDRHISRKTSPASVSMVYLVGDPASFLDSQDYQEPKDVALARMITVTGDRNNGSNMAIIWSLSIGASEKVDIR